MPAPDATLTDAAGRSWTLSDHLDAAAVLLFLRGDWWAYCNGQLVSLAQRHGDLTAAGARVFGISVDSPAQHAAMIEKLGLPFPLLSDPDRSAAIGPYGAADERDPRQIARPVLVVVAPDGEEAARIEARDFADRPAEDEVVERVRALSLPPTTQPPPEVGPAEPGPKAMSVRALLPYYRGARFAAVALGRRHPDIADETTRYVAQMDRYHEAMSTRR